MLCWRHEQEGIAPRKVIECTRGLNRRGERNIGQEDGIFMRQIYRGHDVGFARP